MVEVNNLTKFRIRKKFYTGVAKMVLRGENRLKENLSIAFVPPSEIQTLNRRYRRKDKPTDVLSFERPVDFKDAPAEVVICPAVVKEKNRHTAAGINRALAETLIHGILHALGYDHERSRADEEKMFEKQEHYMTKIPNSKHQIPNKFQ